MSEVRPSESKWFAAYWDWAVRQEGAHERRMREEAVGGARGRVLEIGCGTGANFPYYGDGVSELIATDPNPHMLERARKKADEVVGLPIKVQPARAEELPFADSSFDTVVSTANMCTIQDPPKALAEIKRVLKSDGEYRFFDHVRYDHAFGAFWQDLITPVWRRLLGTGCHPNRDVAQLIRGAGFSIVQLEQLKPVPPIPPMIFVRPHIIGLARPA